jgi:hypothetical protein
MVLREILPDDLGRRAGFSGVILFGARDVTTLPAILPHGPQHFSENAAMLGNAD